MWRLLRESFPESRFRRQVPIRHYIVDFASHRLKILIEIDGGQHTVGSDAARSGAIEAEDYRIVRFWNNEVLENGDGCMIRLGQILGHAHPLPTPPRQSFNTLRTPKPPYPSPIKGESGQ